MLKAKGENLLLTVNDIIISYNDSGTGEIPIIFIHGFPFDKSSWQPQFEFLNKYNRVITYDIRGFGRSTCGTKEISIANFADDLIDFMEQLELNTAIVCGLSMGGYILLNAVNRFPDKFAAIILSDTQCIADSNETIEKRQQSISSISSGGIKEFTESFLKNVFIEDTLNKNLKIVDKTRSIILATAVDSLTSTLNAIANREETCSSLKKITIPTLIICGKEDKITPPLQAKLLKDSITNSTLCIIENAAHLSNLEKSEAYNTELAKFISNLQL